MLPGRTANFWARRASTALFAAIPGVLCLAGAGVNSHLGFAVAVAGLLWVFACGFALIWAEIQEGIIDKRERAAGYATKYGRGTRRYWQLDPATGAVVRHPGSER